jgi:RNA recognition motif-containing protein
MPNTVVRLHNLPYDVTEDQIRAVIEVVAPISTLRLCIDPRRGRPNGICLVELDENAVPDLMKLAGTDFMGRCLQVARGTAHIPKNDRRTW